MSKEVETKLSEADRLKLFKNSPIIRRRLVKYAIANYEGWLKRSYKEVNIDASDLLDDDTPPYYYLKADATKLVLVWLFDSKQDNLKDYTDYAFGFMAELLAKGLPELLDVNDIRSLFYSGDDFSPHYCTLSRSKLA